MKKYFILGAAIIVFGLLINYTLGGFASIEPKMVDVHDYTIYGAAFEGSYKSDQLTELVEKMRVVQKGLGGKADVVIVNYLDQNKENIGLVKNFVGIRANEALPDSITKTFEKRIIKAKKALRAKVKIKPLVMPSPEKVKKKAFEMAEFEGVKLQNLSIEQYLDTGILVVEFPLENED